MSVPFVYLPPYITCNSIGWGGQTQQNRKTMQFAVAICETKLYNI